MTTIDKRPHLTALTGLRFVAALQVLLFHLGWARLDGLPQSFANLTVQAHHGVSLFFVLSGFILVYNYSTLRQPLTVPRPAFWSARFARVYPVYLFALLVAAPFFFTDMATGPISETLTRVVGGFMVLGLIQAWMPQTAFLWNFPSWSLSNEAFFYGVFPRAAQWLQTLSSRTLLLAVLVLWLIGQVPTAAYLMCSDGGLQLIGREQQGTWLVFISCCPLFRLPEFVAGMVGGMLFLRREKREPGDWWFGAIASALAAVAVTATLVFRDALPAHINEHHGMLTPLFVLLVYGLALGHGPLAWLLSRPLMTLLGEASYSLYILHFPVLLWWNRTLPSLASNPNQPTWAFVVLSSLACIAVSVLAYRLIERPANAVLKRRLSRGVAGQAAVM